MSSLTVQQVLSTRHLNSRIFDDIIRRLYLNAPEGLQVERVIRPAAEADVYHYHRPNREGHLRSRSVTTVHHDLRDDDPWLRKNQFLDRYHEAAAVICLNRTQYEELRAAGLNNMVRIGHGVDRDIFPLPVMPRKRNRKKITLGLISVVHRRGVKGEDYLYQMMRHLDPDCFDFLFVGTGRSQTAQMAREAGFSARSYDNLPYSLFPRIYEQLDMLLITSRFEGGPGCLPEAVGSALPVASTPVGMCPDLIRHGENGLLLQRDVRRDGEMLQQLAEDGGRRLEQLQQGAFARAGSVLSWLEVCERHYGLYRATSEDRVGEWISKERTRHAPSSG